jgi:hypothetical protein
MVAPVTELQVPNAKESTELSEAVKVPPAIVLLDATNETRMDPPSDEVAAKAPAEF